LPAVPPEPSDPILVDTLVDGGQPASRAAELLAGWLTEARTSLDVAIYDFALSPAVRAPIVEACRAATARGVRIRLVYNLGHGRPVPVPPPPEPDEDQIRALGGQVRAIAGIPDLMHHKYVVRDGQAVWTGSANWTDDSWTREENVLVRVASPALAAWYERDFADLWERGTVQASGHFETAPTTVDGVRLQPWFSPGRGRTMSTRIAAAIAHATRRIRIASPVITSGPVLGALDQVEGTVDVAGVFDGTQMLEALGQWRDDPHASWKGPLFRGLFGRIPLGAKRTTPYAPGSVHDYLHAKCTVVDDTVFVGSYNLSHSGEFNAENVLELHDPSLAERLAGFVDQLRARYPSDWFAPQLEAVQNRPGDPSTASAPRWA
jgi:phosphatidylserine/phosphatidylglycerophosphate/cardiolipin synthase-like enzyme